MRPNSPLLPFPIIRWWIAALGFGLAMAATARAQLSAMGSWEFDETRQELYEASVRAAQTDGTMSEIAARMGMARIQNSTYKFDLDPEGRPRLTRMDRATGQTEQTRITVTREGQELRVVEERTGNVFRLRPEGTDRNRLTLVDEARRQVIPLKRR